MSNEISNQQAQSEITACSHRLAEREHIDPYAGPYTATAGTIELHDNGHPIGTKSFTSYRKPGEPGRPVTFFGGGGPIAAGTLWGGPELSSPLEIAHDPGGHLPAKPSLRPHPHALLHDSDVVNFDAMGVGYGRAYPGESPSHFYGVNKDARAFAAAIRWYMREYRREEDPIILSGGSYGVRRTITIANLLHHEGTDIAGMAFISPGYDDSLRQFDTDDPRPHITQLPAFTAAALYHAGIRDPGSIRAFQAEARAFAWNTYANAITQNSPSGRAIRDTAFYTGLPEEVVAEHNLRIPPEVFQKQFLGRQGLQLSGIDTRLAFPSEASDEFDPAIDVWRDTYIDLARGHFREHFGYTPEADDHQYIGNVNAAPHWEYDGIWRERNAKAALTELSANLPDLPIVETIGVFDIRSLPDRCQIFWDEMSLPGQDISLKPKPGEPDTPTVTPGAITRYEFFSGHHPGADPVSKRHTTNILRLLARTAASRNSR